MNLPARTIRGSYSTNGHVRRRWDNGALSTRAGDDDGNAGETTKFIAEQKRREFVNLQLSQDLVGLVNKTTG